jgi:TraU protein
LTCTAEGVASFAGSPELITDLIGSDACIGNWGPLYPRQMRTRGPTQVWSAAVAAYRGMSIARTELEKFPFPVDTTGKIQQAYPNVSACAMVGKTPLPRSMKPSPDGAYGWFYWRPVACCIPFDAPATCYGS